MAELVQIAVYSFKATAQPRSSDTSQQPSAEIDLLSPPRLPGMPYVDAVESEEINTSSKLASYLDRRSTSIAQDIEASLRRILALQFEPRVELTVLSGSIVVVGTVILTALAPIVAEGLKKALQDTVASAIKFAVTATIGTWLKGLVPLETQIQASAELVSEDIQSATTSTSVPPQTPRRMLSYLEALTALNTLVLIALLVLLLIIVTRLR
jgi:hypothetical protein